MLRLAVAVTGFVAKGTPNILHPEVYCRLASANHELRALGAENADVFFNLDLNIYPQLRLGCSNPAKLSTCSEQKGYNASNLNIIGRVDEHALQWMLNAVQPVSVAFTNSTFCNSSPLCAPNCSDVSRNMPHRMWEQYARWSLAFDQVESYERAHGFRYDWVGRVRSDFVHHYWTAAIVSHAVYGDSTSIITSYTRAPNFGQLDLAAMVPRAVASAYFDLPLTTCDWLRCASAILEAGEDLKNERLLAEWMFSQGVGLRLLCNNKSVVAPSFARKSGSSAQDRVRSQCSPVALKTARLQMRNAAVKTAGLQMRNAAAAAKSTVLPRWSSIEEMITALRLHKHYSALLAEHGFDSVDNLADVFKRDATGNSLQMSLERAGLKIGHAVKIVNALHSMHRGR